MFSSDISLFSPLGLAIAALVVLVILFSPAVRDRARKDRSAQKERGDSHDDPAL